MENQYRETRMVGVRIHIMVPATEITHGDDVPVLEGVKRLLNAADAINPEILEQIGGVLWSLDGQEEAPVGRDELTLAMARGHLQGENGALLEVLRALQEDHPEGCACRAHVIIGAVRQVDRIGDDFDAVETVVEEAIERIL